MDMPALASDRPTPAPAVRDDVADFDALYQARYGDVVAMLHAYLGDLGEAQDLAQEAFCRAWQRWRAVATYDEPLVWVRRVAMNLATSRWRRLRVAKAHLRRERPVDVPPLGPDHVALVAALRRLPSDQRRAVVLHHVVDLPVADVAHEMQVAVGTVKSWLHRGRAALAAQLTDPAADPGAKVADRD
jgi:RNA polymerase sigma-70 factor (ECF subfamily)